MSSAVVHKLTAMNNRTCRENEKSTMDFFFHLEDVPLDGSMYKHNSLGYSMPGTLIELWKRITVYKVWRGQMYNTWAQFPLSKLLLFKRSSIRVEPKSIFRLKYPTNSQSTHILEISQIHTHIVNIEVPHTRLLAPYTYCLTFLLIIS